MAGFIGFRLIDFALVSALIAMVSYGLASGRRSDHKKWEKIGNIVFILHGVSILSAIALLWGMIFTQQYQFAYVYNHSSNSLPIQYIIACLWEGQEGSFLLWLFWHAVLGSLLIWKAGSWRPGVMAVISSVQAILVSMVLGVNISSGLAHWLVGLLAVVILLILLKDYLVWPGRMPRVHSGFDGHNLIPVGAVALVLMVIFNLMLGQSGWLDAALAGEPAFILQLLFLIGFVVLLWHSYLKQNLSSHVLASGMALSALVYVVAVSVLGDFKIGSSPFLTIQQAFPKDPTLAADPNFVPDDGNGLNALLQNYWMVIHPPTLFLGFASTVVAFAYVIAALWQRRYNEWIGPASPWAIFSIMILGVGIIMGGYWAYETLNFGGYWNWDPVENSSLVPWLVGVGGLHAMLSFRKSKRNLKAAMILMASVFVLVLYSTFLTRSGILGESSVHSFTDLGLMGQLLLLLFIYLGGVLLLFIHHWRSIPQAGKVSTLYSREFFLFLAAIVLSFSAIEIILVTSIPVINKVFGTNMAPPNEVSYFYYRWNVWVGILIAGLSAIGQYFYWTKIEKATLSKALFRPFLLAAIAAGAVMISLALAQWQFSFREKTGLGVLAFADDILLFTALFTLMANGIIAINLIRRSKKNIRHIGGSLAHIGFGLMLLGILFSSGYEDTLSMNVNPKNLENGMGKDAARTNVVLSKNKAVDIKGYRLVYRGVKPPVKPFSDFHLVNSLDDFARVGFSDAEGYRFAAVVPVPEFLKSEVQQTKSTKLEAYLNMAKIAHYISKQVDILPIEMLNGRRLYTVDFYPLKRNEKGAIEVTNEHAFRLYPEAEAQGEEGIIAHPDRAIFPAKDIYTHVTGRPAEADAAQEWVTILEATAMGKDTVLEVEGMRVKLGRVERLPTPKEFGAHEILTELPVIVSSADSSWTVRPQLMVNTKTLQIIRMDALLASLNWRVRFVGVSPQEEKLRIAIMKAKPRQDYVILTAISKPFVNLLWLGTFVMTIGFLLAIWRRVSDLK